MKQNYKSVDNVESEAVRCSTCRDPMSNFTAS